MSENKIILDIITPERQVSSEAVDFIVLPTEAGEVGVLPGHTHLLTQLGIGELRVTKGPEVSHLAVAGGFAEVHPERVRVFAETAEMSQEIDSERARLAAERARQEITKASTPRDLALAEAKLRRALLRLRVAEGLSRRRTN